MTPAHIEPGAAFPLPAGNYFGDINGPDASHGGGRASDMPTVAAIQVVVGVDADGTFGPNTIAAVKTWQSAHGLNADGQVGPLTWAAMFPATPDPTPAPGVDLAALAAALAPLLLPQIRETIEAAVAADVAKLRITIG